jgi:hypothetical protein
LFKLKKEEEEKIDFEGGRWGARRARPAPHLPPSKSIYKKK